MCILTSNWKRAFVTLPLCKRRHLAEFKYVLFNDFDSMLLSSLPDFLGPFSGFFVFLTVFHLIITLHHFQQLSHSKSPLKQLNSSFWKSLWKFGCWHLQAGLPTSTFYLLHTLVYCLPIFSVLILLKIHETSNFANFSKKHM